MLFLVPPDPGQTEIIAEGFDSGLAGVFDDALEPFKLLIALRACEKNIVPVGRIEVLNAVNVKTIFRGLLLERQQIVQLPDGIFRGGGTVIAVFIRRGHDLLVIVGGEMDDQMCAAALPGELEILRREHMAVKADAELHIHAITPLS